MSDRSHCAAVSDWLYGQGNLARGGVTELRSRVLRRRKVDEFPVSEHRHWNIKYTGVVRHTLDCVCVQLCLSALNIPSGNSISLVSKVMATSSSVAPSSADRGAGEGEGMRGGNEGEVE